jgi:hypothetical protein
MREDCSIYPISQGCRILQQRHSGFFRRAISLALITAEACSREVIGTVPASSRSWQNVIYREIEETAALSAILASVMIARENPCAL